jgi:AbrB family looped-hinge helix DNA binding protein
MKKIIGNNSENCSIESIVNIDERGQMILPKELRAKANIKAGDKLALVSILKDDEVCCISMVKAEKLSSLIGDIILPASKSEK